MIYVSRFAQHLLDNLVSVLSSLNYSFFSLFHSTINFFSFDWVLIQSQIDRSAIIGSYAHHKPAFSFDFINVLPVAFHYIWIESCVQFLTDKYGQHVFVI
jgi:hypothetical protein